MSWVICDFNGLLLTDVFGLPERLSSILMAEMSCDFLAGIGNEIIIWRISTPNIVKEYQSVILSG
jgi:hypothetical protein